MSIDPEKFEAQGAPPREVAKQVWEDMGHPGARPLGKELEKRGWKVSWRTLARWKIDGNWIGATLPPPLERPYEASGKVVEIVQAAVRDEVEIIDTRIKELLVMSEAELDRVEQKSRKILNIVLTEVAARRANVLMLIPKDTGVFIQAMTEASKAMLTGGIDQNPAVGDPRVINGNVVDMIPETPLQQAIRKFKRDKELS